MGFVCPPAHAIGTAAGTVISVGGDSQAANMADAFGDIVLSYTSSAGNDTAYVASPVDSSVTVKQVYGDTLSIASTDSNGAWSDTLWFSAALYNAGNGADSMVFSVSSVIFQTAGSAPDSFNVQAFDPGGTNPISFLDVPVNNSAGFNIAVHIKTTAPRNDTASITLVATARGGLGGDPAGYTGLNGVPYAGDGDDSIVLRVYVQNRAPVANAGADTAVVAGDTGLLSGSLSSDSDGDILTYAWSQVSGTAVTLSNTGIVNPTFISDVTFTGNYVFQLTVTDPLGASSSDTILVGSGNVAPVAVTGADTSVPNNDTVTLYGSASSDANGDSLTYSWTWISGPTVVTVQNSSDSNARVYMTQKGTYSFRLLVNDGSDTDDDTIQVTVLNTIPVAAAGADSTVGNNDTYTLNGSTSSDSDIGDTLVYLWTQLSGPGVSIGNPSSAVTTFYVSSAGVYVFQLAAFDGTDTGTDNVQFTVGNTPPSANAGTDTSLYHNDTVSLNASASFDADSGNTLTYAWSMLSGPNGPTIQNAGVSIAAVYVNSVGTYVFQVSVGDGADTTVDTVSIGALNRKPIADAGLDTATLAGWQVWLSGAASSDSDGDSLTFVWTQLSGTAVTLMSAATANPTFISETGYFGVYTFKLEVYDGFETSLSDSVDVTATNGAPVAAAGIDISGNKNDTIQLDASGSVDPNGDTLTFLWSQLSGPYSVTLSDTSDSRPTFTTPTAGQYVFEVRVSDGVDSSTDSVGVTINVAPSTATLNITNSSWSTVTSISDVGIIYAQVTDASRNTDDLNPDNLTVTLTNMSTSETETMTLTESGNATGIFRGSQSTSNNAADSVSGSGVLRIVSGNSVRADYTDPNDATDTESVTVSVVGAPASVTFDNGSNHQLGLVNAFLSNPLALTVRDNSSQGIAGETVTFSISYTPTGAAGQALSQTSVAADSTGHASVSFQLGSLNGVYQVDVSVGSLTAKYTAYTNGADWPANTWKMFTPNKAPQNDTALSNSPADVIGDDLPNYKIYRWDPSADSSGAFARYVIPTAVKRGEAYWVKNDVAGAIDVSGSSSMDTFDIRLAAGWNQIGSGQYFFVDWNRSVRFIADTGSPVAPDQADTDNLIQNAVYWWDGGAYQWGPNGSHPQVQLKPFVGFWLWADQACTMRVSPNPYDTMATAMLNQAPKLLSAMLNPNQDQMPVDNWQIQILGSAAGKTDALNYIGVKPDAASAMDAARFEAPGVVEGYLQVSITDAKGSSRAASYAEGQITTVKEWRVNVVTDQAGQVVSLTWDNIQGIPDMYEAFIVGNEGAIDMRKSAGLTFKAAESGVTNRSYTVYVGYADYLAAAFAPALDKTQTFAFPNPGPDDATGLFTFKYNLNATSNIVIKIFDVSGRLVKELHDSNKAAPASATTWDSTNRYGQKLGSGVYIYIIEATDVTSGAKTKFVDKVAIVR